MRDADIDGRQLDLISNGPIPVLQTPPEYFGLPIALAYASLSAHSIEPRGDTRFVLVVSSVMNCSAPDY